jgi:uncharacterized protein
MREIEELWAQVPEVHCKGLCADYCGPIDASVVERRLLRERGVRLRALPLIEVGTGRARPCPALVDGRCTVYDIRPLICRIWGAVRRLQCEHGCEPDRWLSDLESRALINRARFLHQER